MANTDVLHKTTKWSNMCLGNVFEDRLVGRVILSTQMWLFHKKKNANCFVEVSTNFYFKVV